MGDRLHAYRLLGQPQPGQPVPGGLHHHDVVPDEHGVAGLPQIRGQRGHYARHGVVPAQRVVVRVADRDRTVGQRGDPSGCWSRACPCHHGEAHTRSGMTDATASPWQRTTSDPGQTSERVVHAESLAQWI
jgi:hypothetical protein